MASRMEKYHDDEQNRTSSRLERNKQKYDDFKNMAYTEFPAVKEVTIPTKFIDKDEPFNREDYQRQRVRSSARELEVNTIEEKTLPFSFLEETNSNEYDINEVLKKARENRSKEDELEYKRKLRASDFNILEGLDQEKLEKIVQKKKEMYRDGEDSDIEDLINTITSNSLSRKVNERLKEEENASGDEDLLSELLPDRIDETIITEAISEDMVENYEPKDSEEDEDEKLDTSFYTRSMDLSEQDLVNEIVEKSEELDTSFVDNSSENLFFKVLSVIFVLVVIAVILFIVYNTCRVKWWKEWFYDRENW